MALPEFDALPSAVVSQLKRELKAELRAELKHELQSKMEKAVAREIARLKDEFREEFQGTLEHDVQGDDGDSQGHESKLSTRRQLQSFSRKLSFSRRPKSKTDSITKEIDIHKETEQEPLGMILAECVDKSIRGAVVSEIDAGTKLDRHRKLKPGDCIHCVNGQAVTCVREASELLRASKGAILLCISRRPLPPGWKQKYVVVDGKIKIWYRNKAENLSMFSHPFGNEMSKAEVNEEDDPSDSEDEVYDDAHRTRSSSISDAISRKLSFERNASVCAVGLSSATSSAALGSKNASERMRRELKSQPV